MEETDPRAVLATLIRERNEDCAGLSRLLGRNAAYIQQYLTRGSPRRLAETDRATLARYFGVPEARLGGPAAAVAPALRPVPRLDVAASAGPGAVAVDGTQTAAIGVSDQWLRRLAPRGGFAGLSLIRVTGHSMTPTLDDGDELLVDTLDVEPRPGIVVLRLGDALLVKRLVRDGAGLAIRSDNPDADPVLFDPAEPPAIVGRALWFGRALRRPDEPRS